MVRASVYEVNEMQRTLDSFLVPSRIKGVEESIGKFQTKASTNSEH